MPVKFTTKIILLFSLLAISITTIGQSSSNPKSALYDNWQINYNLGFTQFYGDASNNGYFKKFSGETAFGTGFTVRKYFNSTFGLGFNFLFSGIKSYKDKRATGAPAEISLTGKYLDGNINLLVNFNSLFWGPGPRKFSVYGIVGLGYAAWNTQLMDLLSGMIINSGDDVGSYTLKKGGFVVPAGVGVNYMLNNKWALNFEITLRTVLNDDVDNWRDGFKYDQPLYTSFGISYFINRKGSSSKPKSKSRKTQGRTVRSEPVKPEVPIYDYRMQHTKAQSIGTTSDIIIIEPKLDKLVMPTDVIYRVQIMAMRDKILSISSLRNRFNIAGDIFENYQDGVYRYSTGTFSSYNEALQFSHILKGKGIHDAFVVAYRNDKRIPIHSNMKY